MIDSLPRVSLAVALTLLMAACTNTPGGAADAPAVVADHGVLRIPEKSPLRSRIKVAPVEWRETPHVLIAPAVVEADPARTVNILAPLTGRVVELKVGLGAQVTRGQLLAVIASGDFAQAQSDATKAADVLGLAKKSLERAQGVKDAGGSAQKDLEAAQSAYVQAQAEATRAQTRLAVLGASTHDKGGSRRIEITAPQSGTVTTLATAAGAYANDPNAVLMTVTNLDHVWITANVAENEAAQIAAGQPVDVTLPAWPERSFHGTVQFVSTVLDPDSRRLKARIALANADGALKPNMFATANFQVPQPKAAFVPQSALLMNNDSVTVFVEVSPWAFARRTVVLGSDEGANARIVKGLMAGDRVVVAGGVLIND
ncbi:efflux RND transporter periplasmic adaptor subunit [Dyella tabacisoli]|uniref:Efflux RND transporter periplasmic adaptor subunit n=1 Tax=Dyella tabacisoli TaxID=2282381 RepID=A0A369UPN8_9GAMM|nr:efflux RND transporter periplasmic adaptor subunit [Dyella tabacisoli]